MKPPDTPAPPDRNRLRSMLQAPATWGCVCWLLALPWTARAETFAFPGFLLALAAGGLCAYSFIHWVFSLRSPRLGFAVHLGVVATAVALIPKLSVVSGAVSEAPAWIKGQIYFALIAFCPFAALVAKLLLLRLLNAIESAVANVWSRRRSTAKTPAPRPLPTWQIDQDKAQVLSIEALQWSLHALVIVIVVITLFGGMLALSILIGMDQHGLHVGRNLALMVSAAVGVALASPLIVIARARRRTWTITVDSAGIRVSSDARCWTCPLKQLVLVQLRQRTDYARLVFIGPSGRISLLAGLGIKDVCLPPFPPLMKRRLSAAGLVEQAASVKTGMTIWQRPD